jgi:hypothetical protein
MARRGIELIWTDDAVPRLYACLVLDGDPRAEEHAARVGRRLVDDHHALEPLAQEAHPTVDLAKPFFPVGVVGVFGAVALRSRCRHRTGDLGPLDAPELVEFAAQPCVAFRGDESGTLRLGRSVAAHGSASSG